MGEKCGGQGSGAGISWGLTVTEHLAQYKKGAVKKAAPLIIPQKIKPTTDPVSAQISTV